MEQARHRMVEVDLRGRDISDDRVLAAMGSIERERFVPRSSRPKAYADRPLSIGSGQTISQPYIVAFMAQAARLAPDDVVLEVGCGSGYGAAVLASLARKVISVERHPELAERAARRLVDAGFDNVEVVTGDGVSAAAGRGPYSAIVVTAAAASVPDTLVGQLATGGRLVIPVGPVGETQELLVITKGVGGVDTEHLMPVRFVPLIQD